MRILLIDILRTSLEEVWPGAEHSLGLMYLAAVLKRRFADEVEVKIETIVSRPNHADADRAAARAALERFQPVLVGIRCLSIGKDCLQLVASEAKAWNPGCVVVAGGPHPTDDPEDALSGAVDYAAIGEGENTVVEFVAALRAGGRPTEVSGLAYRDGDRVVRTAPRLAIADLDSLPFPDHSMVDLDRFANRFLSFSSKLSGRHANLMTTRGCPYRCVYCHHVLGKQFRARSPENVLAEIRQLHDAHGITDFQIVDDIFNLDLDRAKRICDLIVKSGLRITLSFPNALRGDRVDEELVDKLAAAGAKFISYAVETASPRLQKLIRKNLNLDKTARAIEYTAHAGIVTRGFFMIGFPSETEAEAMQTVEFAKASPLCGATFFTVVYFPGTELYAIARSMGYFGHERFDVQRDYVNVGDGPYEFPLERLVEIKRKGIREFAFTRERVENALRLLPGYFTSREIDNFFMAYVVSSGARLEDIPDEFVRGVLRRHFGVAQAFSQRNAFYV